MENWRSPFDDLTTPIECGLGEESSTEAHEDGLDYSRERLLGIVRSAFLSADPVFYDRYQPEFISLGELLTEGRQHTHLQYRVSSKTLEPDLVERFLRPVVDDVTHLTGKKFAISFVIDRDG